MKKITVNKLLIVAGAFFSKLGDSLSNTKVVMPWMLNSLGAPSFFTGLLVPIRESGSLLPQVILSGWLQTKAKRKGMVALSAALQAGAMLLIGVVALTTSGWLAGTLIIFCLVAFSLARGLASLASKDVLGKIIPKQQRGGLMGWSATAAGAITILLGVALFFSLFKSEHNYAEFVLAAAVVWMLSCLAYALVREDEGETEAKKDVVDSLRSSWDLLKSDKPFRNFVVARALIMSSSLVAPYFILLAQSKTGQADISVLGGFLVIAGVASLFSSWIWGKAADDNSKRVLQYCSLAAALLCLAAVAVTLWGDAWQVEFAMILFLLLSVVHQGVRLGRKTYVVDLAEGNDRTRYVATSNTAIGVLLLTTGLISALLSLASLWLTFLIFAFMSLTAFYKAGDLQTV